MADITFIVHSDWLENIKSLPLEQQDKIIAEIIRYGTEQPLQYENDVLISSFVNFTKGSIDFSKKNYQSKVEAGKTKGRRRIVDDKEIWKLARTGITAQQVAEQLGITKSSVDHSEGWKNRKNDTFII
jgi:hypothetical protein